VRGGGLIGPGKPPTPPNPLSGLTIELTRFVSSSDRIPWKGAVEAVDGDGMILQQYECFNCYSCGYERQVPFGARNA